MERIVFACSCEDSMTLDAGALRACGGEVRMATHLCRSQLDRFRAALASGRPITVGCTQEAPLFEEVADEAGTSTALDFVNIREAAGWSDSGGTGAKMAALLAAAAEPMPQTPLVSLQSAGVALIYGRDEAAIAVGQRLAASLDVTVLLHAPGEVTPPGSGAFPVLRGTIGAARGHLGAFELTVNDYAQPAAASRATLRWGPARDGAVSRCDVLLDLSGGPALFHATRPGYLRADPGRAESVERMIGAAQALVGTFDKPRFIDFSAGLCAHSRNQRTGCTRCLDQCPTGAIAPDGDHVAIDAAICAGCGGCAAVCPTGAAVSALPPDAALLRRLRVMLMTYRDAGGQTPAILLHDAGEGQAMIDACARHGAGLPAHVLPVRLHEVAQASLALIVSLFAYGVGSMIFLVDPKGHAPELTQAEALLAGVGLGGRCTVLDSRDPDALSALPALAGLPRPSRFLPLGQGRELLVAALKELHRAAGAGPGAVALPPGAAFGGVAVSDSCTLCHACVAACPTAALRADPDTPMLGFDEAACVQCGLCRATCPEAAITLLPRLDPAAWSAPPVVLRREEPFACTECGKPFATRSGIARVAARLEGHWMYSGANAARRASLFMCDTCRVSAAINAGFDPHAAPPRPPVRGFEVP